ncbi:MAG: ABC transporter substrate-binding protein [Chloroflexota bacterium]
MSMQALVSRRVLLRQAFGATLVLPAVGVLAACGGGVTPSVAGTTTASTPATTAVTSSATLTAASSATSTVAATTSVASTAAVTSAAATVTVAKVTATTGALSAADAPAAGPKVVLHYEPWAIDQPTHGGPVGYQHLQKAFNQASPNGYKVNTVTPPGKFYEALQIAVVAGTSPDTFQEDLGPVAIYAGQKVSEALDSYIARDKFDLTQLYPFSVQMMKWDGKVYAMMQHTDIVLLWYNADLMRELGMDAGTPPKTWSDMEALAQKGVLRTGNLLTRMGYDSNSWPVCWIQANGGKILSDDGRKALFDSPQAVETVEWMRQMYNQVDGGKAAVDQFGKDASGKTAGGQSEGPFENGKVVAYNNGNWEADAMRRAQNQFKFAVSPLPSGPSGPADSANNVYMGGIFCALSASSKRKDGGWEYLKFIGNKPGGVAIETGTADVSGNIEASKDPTVLNDPDTGFGRKETQPLFTQVSGTRDVTGPVSGDIQYKYLGAAVADALQNKTDTTTALKQAVQLANAALDKYYSTVK